MKRNPILLALALLAIPGFSLLAQEAKEEKKPEKDPFAANPEGDPDENVMRSVGILLEFIQTDHLTANELLRKYAPMAADAQELRDELEVMIKAGGADLVETSWIHARSGQRAKTESIEEVISPKEWDPQDLPATASISATIQSDNLTSVDTLLSGDALKGAQNPAAFDTRNVGTTVEVDPVLGADNRTIDLNLNPEIVNYLGERRFFLEGAEDTANGLEHVSVPKFYTMRATTSVSAIDGKYVLVSFLKPHDKPGDRVFLLLRADIILVK